MPAGALWSLLALFCAVAAAAEDLAPQANLPGTLWVFDDRGQVEILPFDELLLLDELSVTVQSLQSTQTVSRDRIWRMEFPGELPQEDEPNPLLIQFHDGDLWHIASVQLQDETWQLTLPDGIRCTRPFDEVRQILWAPPYVAGFPISSTVTRPPMNSGDQLTLKNGDQLQGEVLGLNPDVLLLQTDLGELRLPVPQLARLQLDEQLLAPVAIPESAQILQLRDGSRVTGSRIRLASAGHLECVLAGEVPVKFLIRDLRTIDFVSPTLRPVTGLPIRDWQQTDYFGNESSPVLHGNVDRLPLELSGQFYPQGIGVRSSSRLTWELPTHAAQCYVQVGLHGSAPFRGSVDVEVEGITSTHVVQTLTTSLRLDSKVPVRLLGPLNVKGLQLLIFKTQFGPGADVSDLVNWCSPVIRTSE